MATVKFFLYAAKTFLLFVFLWFVSQGANESVDDPFFITRNLQMRALAVIAVGGVLLLLHVLKRKLPIGMAAWLVASVAFFLERRPWDLELVRAEPGYRNTYDVNGEEFAIWGEVPRLIMLGDSMLLGLGVVLLVSLAVRFPTRHSRSPEKPPVVVEKPDWALKP